MKTLVMACLAGVLAIPAVIYAGEKWKADVVINQNVPYANGGMGAARNSKDGNQNIGCYVSTNGPGKTAGYCWARNAEGEHAGCKWFDNLIYERIVSAMASDSFIHFNWNAYYECTRITVSNASAYEPKR
jgi:hypothetical protein